MKLVFEGYPYETISSILDCTPGFVSQVKQAYATDGIEGLKLKYRGSIPFLTPEERRAVLEWLKHQQEWSLEGLRAHLEDTYAVVFQSDQSYYDLFAAANISYKQAQARNPKRNAERVEAKKRTKQPVSCEPI